MVWLYNFAVKFYAFTIWIASFFNKKANLWIDGRKEIFNQLTSTFQQSSTQNIIWMHVASLGEFEQGRPIIEKLKGNYPNYKILLTFFSPSGYEIRKNYDLADYVFYLPLDTKENAQKFIKIVNPKLVIFVKYEFWYHYLSTLQIQNIPTILVSALFRPGQVFFKSYGGMFKQILRGFDRIFVQNEASYQLLKKYQYQNISLAGDTRVDRVAAIAKQAKSFDLIETFAGQNNVLVCGSTWAPDESILTEFIKKTTDWKIIIAPHEIKEGNINRLLDLFPEKAIQYSKAAKTSVSLKQVLIIDNIGMLSSIYRYGKVAYIGGGFGKGIHNTLEPIAFGLPVIFGPKYTKFKEAVTLVEREGCFSISNEKEFESIMNKLNDDVFYTKASQQAQHYIQQNSGATTQILNYISTIV